MTIEKLPCAYLGNMLKQLPGLILLAVLVTGCQQSGPPQAKLVVGPSDVKNAAFAEAVTEFPERTDQLIASLDLDRPGLSDVKTAVERGDKAHAIELLYDYFKQSAGGKEIREEVLTPGGEPVEMLEHTYTLLGERGTVPRRPDGHLDWNYVPDGKSTQFAHFLNRFGGLEYVVRAARTTGDEKWSRYLNDTLSDWVLANPYLSERRSEPDLTASYHGVVGPEPDYAWVTLNTGIRMRSFIKTFFQMLADGSMEPRTFLLMLSSLEEHGDSMYIFGGFNESNWGNSHMVGLLTLNTTIPEFKATEQWAQAASDRYFRNVRAAVYPDGSQWELATNYGFIVFKETLAFVDLLRKGGYPVPEDIVESFKQQAFYYACSSNPSGEILPSGDSDPVQNIRKQLIQIAREHDYPEVLYIVTNGKEGISPEEPPSRFFDYSGNLISRNSWKDATQWSGFDIGPYGIGHHHPDKLALNIYNERRILIDPGRFIYSWSGGWFPHYGASTRGHNSLMIDEMSQFILHKNDGKEMTDEVREQYDLLRTSPIAESEYRIGPVYDTARGRVTTGYRKDGRGDAIEGQAVHERAIVYKRGEFWFVVDRVFSDRPRKLEAFWHFHPDCEEVVMIDGRALMTKDPEKGNLAILPVKGNVLPVGRLAKGEREPHIQGWYSGKINEWVESTDAVYTSDAPAYAYFGWLMVPFHGTEVPKGINATIDKLENDVAHVSIQMNGAPAEKLIIRLDTPPDFEGEADVASVMTEVPVDLEQVEHPFLLVNESDFPALRKKARKEPFKSVVEHAKSLAKNEPKAGNWGSMASTLDGCTILYPLETSAGKRREYREKILSVIDLWPECIPMMGKGHASTVYASTALYNSILALDMIYNDLSSKELETAEKNITMAYRWFEKGEMADGKRKIAWKLSRLGVLALYQLYQRDLDKAEKAAEAYRHHLLEISMMEDGSWCQSPGYAHARIAGGRLAKNGPVDVLQHTGMHDFYNDPRMVGLMDWINTFSFTPFGSYARFGETGLIGDSYAERSVLLFFMDQYSPRAAGNAVWHLGDAERPFSLGAFQFMFFVLAPEERPDPIMPTSLLKAFSGAALWGREGEKEALSGTVYSLKRQNYEEGGFHHASEDVNSIGINGYGNFLIANAGTNYDPGYPGNTPDGDRWHEAWMQNVVLIGDEQRHPSREGGGLVEGITGGKIEYGTTDSGDALGKSNHRRTLLLIHEGEEGQNGYFALVDEVDAKDNIHMLLHPNTTEGSIREVEADKEYFAPANGFSSSRSDGSEAITVFYATSPKKVTIDSAWKGAFKEDDFKNARLNVEYPRNQEQFLTILFPEDKFHKKPPIEQIEVDKFSGASIHHANGVIDYLLESDGKTQCNYESFSFSAKTFFYRDGESASAPVMLMIQGTACRYGSNGEFAIQSDEPISIQLDGDHGTIVSPGTEVVFTAPGLRAITLDGKPVQTHSKANGVLAIDVPEGEHFISLQP